MTSDKSHAHPQPSFNKITGLQINSAHTQAQRNKLEIISEKFRRISKENLLNQKIRFLNISAKFHRYRASGYIFKKLVLSYLQKAERKNPTSPSVITALQDKPAFEAVFDAIYNNKDIQEFADLIISGLEAALMIGSAIGEHYAPDLKQKMDKQRTEAARKARSAKSVQEVIKQEATEYWKHNPKKRHKPSDTARAIVKKVKDRLEYLEHRPRAWHSDRISDDKKLNDRIRKWVSEIDDLEF